MERHLDLLRDLSVLTIGSDPMMKVLQTNFVPGGSVGKVPGQE